MENEITFKISEEVSNMIEKAQIVITDNEGQLRSISEDIHDKVFEELYRYQILETEVNIAEEFGIERVMSAREDVDTILNSDYRVLLLSTEFDEEESLISYNKIESNFK